MWTLLKRVDVNKSYYGVEFRDQTSFAVSLGSCKHERDQGMAAACRILALFSTIFCIKELLIDTDAKVRYWNRNNCKV